MNLINFEWKKVRILLINFGMEGLGVRNLSSFLKVILQYDSIVNILFLQHGIDEKKANLIANFISYNNYNVVGFSCMTGDYYEARLISRLIKSLPHRPVVIWGGVHPTSSPEECLFEGGADLVFNAAAEISLAKLLSEIMQQPWPPRAKNGFGDPFARGKPHKASVLDAESPP
jgi:radical SAM superfamily enzyme YgiQ (UPF0313 family)